MTVKNQITNFSSYHNFTDNYRQKLQKQNKLSTCVLVIIRTEENLIYRHYTIQNKMTSDMEPERWDKSRRSSCWCQIWFSSWWYSRQGATSVSAVHKYADSFDLFGRRRHFQADLPPTVLVFRTSRAPRSPTRSHIHMLEDETDV